MAISEDLKQEREELTDELRRNLTQYLQAKGINTRKAFRCLSPDHKDDKPSMGLVKKDRLKNPIAYPVQAHCFGCNATYDIFDLIGFDYGLTSFPEQVKKACDLYGRAYPEETGDTGEKRPRKLPQDAQKQKNGISTAETSERASRAIAEAVEGKEALAARIRAWQADIEGAMAYLKGRGLSEETIGRYRLGYDRERNAVVIPIGEDYYIARRIGGGEPRYLNAEGLEARILGAEYLEASEPGPIFITEGAFDALSVEEAGGKAISLNSTSNMGRLVDAIAEKCKASPKKLFILALDNDQAGATATAKLSEALADKHIRHIAVNIAGVRKDASEALQKDGREALRAAIEAAKGAEAKKYREACSAEGTLNQMLDNIKKSASVPCAPTGFKLLDEALNGGLHAGLYVIGAISSLGKTTFALQIADQMAQAGRDVMFFTLEMGAEELVSKSLARHTKLMAKNPLYPKTSRDLTTYEKYKMYGHEEKDLILKAIEAYGQYAGRIYFYEGMDQTGTKQIREAVEKHKEITGNAPVVIVDYLQVIAPRSPNASDKQNADRAVVELKRISRDFKTPVLTLSSFSRAFYDKKASMEAFKESGGIEYSADVLIGLHYTIQGAKQVKGENGKTYNQVCIDTAKSKKADPRVVELLILKNRRGETEVTLRYNYYSKNDLFEELARLD